MHHQSSSALLHHYHYYSIQETSNDLPTPTPPALLILPQHVPAANARRANIIFDARRSSLVGLDVDAVDTTDNHQKSSTSSVPFVVNCILGVKPQSRRLETGKSQETLQPLQLASQPHHQLIGAASFSNSPFPHLSSLAGGTGCSRSSINQRRSPIIQRRRRCGFRVPYYTITGPTSIIQRRRCCGFCVPYYTIAGLTGDVTTPTGSENTVPSKHAVRSYGNCVFPPTPLSVQQQPSISQPFFQLPGPQQGTLFVNFFFLTHILFC